MPDGAGGDWPSRLTRWWQRSYVPLSVLVLGALSLGMLVWTNQLNRQELLQCEFEDALQDLRIRLSTAHLWLEEAITSSVDEIDMAWSDLAQARSLADALVEGGDTENGETIPPVPDMKARQQAVVVRQLLDEFVVNAHERWRTLAPIGSPLDNQTNEIFESIQRQGAELAKSLKEQKSRTAANTGRVYVGILLAWSLVVAGSTTQLVHHERKRQAAERALERAKDQLEIRVAERTMALDELIRELHLELDERKKTEAALRESEARSQALSGRLLTAQETERRRISTELHDELGHALAYLKIQVGLLQEELRADQATTRIECARLSEFIEQTIENVHRISRDLSPSILEDLGLSAALHWLVETCVGNHETEVASTAPDLDQLLTPNEQILVYRIVQEALTNVQKYAGATHVQLAIQAQADRLVFAVSDDGRGFRMERGTAQPPGSPCGRGLGMTTMRERAQMLGGTLEVCSEEGKGTRILLAVPLQKWRDQ